jgi:hypothetical protein
LPTVLSLEVQADSSSGLRYKMNSAYLQDKEVVTQLVEVWKHFLSTLGFFGKLCRLMHWYKTFRPYVFGRPTNVEL